MFAITETPGSTGFVEGSFTATLLSVSPLTGQLTIDTSNISLVNLEVVCENTPGGSVVNTKRLDVNEAGKLTILITFYYQFATDGVSSITVGRSISLDGDLNLGVIYSNWTAPSGNFDIDYYEVSVFRKDEPTPLLMFNTTSTSMTATYTAKPMDIVFARIVVISKCGVRSEEFQTNDVSPQRSESKFDIISLSVYRPTPSLSAGNGVSVNRIMIFIASIIQKPDIGYFLNQKSGHTQLVFKYSIQ